MKIATYKQTLTLLFETNATTITGTTDKLNGIIREVVVYSPALEGGHTYTLSILDGTYTLLTLAGIAQNTNTAIHTQGTDQNLELPVNGELNLSIVTSGDETANIAFVVKIYYEQE
jgi:hypothetical protein